MLRPRTGTQRLLTICSRNIRVHCGCYDRCRNKSCASHITKHEPAVILNCTAGVRRQSQRNPSCRSKCSSAAVPAWLRTSPRRVTAESLIIAIATFLAAVAGGQFLLQIMPAPNTWAQYNHVRDRLVRIEVDPCMQAAMAGARPDERLAAIGFLQDNRQVLQPEFEE